MAGVVVSKWQQEIRDPATGQYVAYGGGFSTTTAPAVDPSPKTSNAAFPFIPLLVCAGLLWLVMR